MQDEYELVQLSRSEIYALIELIKHGYEHKTKAFVSSRWTLGSALGHLCRVIPFGIQNNENLLKVI